LSFLAVLSLDPILQLSDALLTNPVNSPKQLKQLIIVYTLSVKISLRAEKIFAASPAQLKNQAPACFPETGFKSTISFPDCHPNYRYQ